MHGRPLQLGVALALVLQIGEGARAHSMEHLVQAALHPTDPQVLVLRFLQGGDGLFYTDDGGASWRMVCKSAIYDSTSLINDMVVTGDGRVLLATPTGAYEDDGHGCGWTLVPELADRWVLDFAQHPSDPDVVFAVASDTARTAYGILRRDGAGMWFELGSDDTRIVQRVYAAQTADGLRLYASALVDTVSVDGIDMQNYVIRVSDDEGASWREHPYGPTQGAFRLEGVDPSDPDRLIAIVRRPEVPGHTLDEDLDQVVVSSDQGATFTHYLVLTESSNVALAPDGRVFIGDIGSTLHSKATNGLWSAPDLATTPEQIGEYPVACVAFEPQGNTLLACQRWWFGPVDTDGVFSASMRFHEVDGFVQCAGVDLTATCQRQLCRSYCLAEHFAQAPVCSAYDESACSGGGIIAPPAVTDGGSAAGGVGGSRPAGGAAAPPDAGADAGDSADGEARGDDGCSCAAAGAARTTRGVAVLAVCVLGVLGWRVRTRASRRGAFYFSSKGSLSTR